MVVKGSGIHGSENSGVETVEERAGTAVSSVVGAAIGAAIAWSPKPIDRMTGPEVERRYATNNPIYQNLLEAYINEGGVPADIAHEAAIAHVTGEKLEKNKYVQEANRIARENLEQKAQKNEPSIASTGKPQPVAAAAQSPVQDSSPGQHASSVSNESAKAKPEVNTERAYKNPEDMTWQEALKTARDISKESGVEISGKRNKDNIYEFIKVHGPQPPTSGKEVETEKTKDTQVKSSEAETTPDLSEQERGHKATTLKPVLKIGATPSTGLEPSETNLDTEQSSEETKDISPQATAISQSGASLTEKTKPGSEVTDNNLSPKPQSKLGSTLAQNTVDGYKKGAVPEDLAQEAVQDRLEGKDGTTSQAIAQANKQFSENTVKRDPLHQMFYDALVKSKVDPPELADKAALDMANNKGALSSNDVKDAQNQVLDRDIAQSKLPERQKNWLRASRYNLIKDPKKRDEVIALQGFKQGLNKKKVSQMLQLSPEAKRISKLQGDGAAHKYVDGVKTKAFATFKNLEKSSAPTQPLTRMRKKKVEMGV